MVASAKGYPRLAILAVAASAVIGMALAAAPSTGDGPVGRLPANLAVGVDFSEVTAGLIPVRTELRMLGGPDGRAWATGSLFALAGVVAPLVVRRRPERAPAVPARAHAPRPSGHSAAMRAPPARA